MIGSIGARFLPLMPTVFAAMIPREVFAEAFVETVHKLVGVSSILSAGVEGDKVVLPPLAHGYDRAQVIANVRNARQSAIKLMGLYAQMLAAIARDVEAMKAGSSAGSR